jgi:hypothetical protein
MSEAEEIRGRSRVLCDSLADAKMIMEIDIGLAG